MADWRDRIKGGRADKRKPADFDAEQLKKGIEHELEHTDDPKVAEEIAMDHLAEDPKYYDHLEERSVPSMSDVFETGERFKRLTGQLAVKGVRDPAALAASIGRKKYGKTKFQQMASRKKT